MEKLRARDDFEEVSLSDAQKEEIADIRSRYRAKIAELEIHQQSKIQAAASFDEMELLKNELSAEKERLESEMEDKVSAVRTK